MRGRSRRRSGWSADRCRAATSSGSCRKFFSATVSTTAGSSTIRPSAQPSPSALGLEPFKPDRAGDREWVARRPVRGASGGPEDVAITTAHDEGLSIRATAVKLGLSRQTVARTRDAHGIPSRPGRQPRFHVDIGWLREQYETERRTAVSIARELGCSPTTIRRHLRAAGLTHGAT